MDSWDFLEISTWTPKILGVEFVGAVGAVGECGAWGQWGYLIVINSSQV